MIHEQKAFIFIGRSGCGKGTQSRLLSDYLKKIDTERNILYIQTGAEFREFISGDSDTQKKSKKIYDDGGLQPEFLAVYMWANALVKKYRNGDNLIFDGMPRKSHEAGVLHSILDFYGLNKLYIINIDISKEEAIHRLTARGRLDDNVDDIKERLHWYENEVVPTLEYYKSNPLYNFVYINGEQDSQKVHEEIISNIYDQDKK